MAVKIMWKKFKRFNEPLFCRIYPTARFFESPKYLGQIMYVHTLLRVASDLEYNSIERLRDVINSDDRLCYNCDDPFDSDTKLDL